MAVSSGTLQAEMHSGDAVAPTIGRHARAEWLQRLFGVEFNLVDGGSGEVLHWAPGHPRRDWRMRAELCRAVARRGRPEFLEEESPFLTLALPVAEADGRANVAVATFVTRPVPADEDISQPAELLGMEPKEAWGICDCTRRPGRPWSTWRQAKVSPGRCHKCGR